MFSAASFLLANIEAVNVTCNCEPLRIIKEVPEIGHELTIEEMQKKFDEISTLINKTLPQLEAMSILQIQIQEERNKINKIRIIPNWDTTKKLP